MGDALHDDELYYFSLRGGQAVEVVVGCVLFLLVAFGVAWFERLVWLVEHVAVQPVAAVVVWQVDAPAGESFVRHVCTVTVFQKSLGTFLRVRG